MKYTSNYIIYLSAENTVYCAKCRLTGKFVKRILAQAEYELEYVYKHFILSVLAMFITFLCYYSSLFNTSHNTLVLIDIEMINNDMNNALLNKDYVLFNKLNSKRFELLYC